MMKTDASAAQTFWYWKKTFLPDLPFNKKIVWNFLVFQKTSPLPPPWKTHIFQSFQVVLKENAGLMWVK